MLAADLDVGVLWLLALSRTDGLPHLDGRLGEQQQVRALRHARGRPGHLVRGSDGARGIMVPVIMTGTMSLRTSSPTSRERLDHRRLPLPGLPRVS
jgi:hypothetical protein